MEDFDYLAPDSNAAWLDGRGDGRFERYEKFYQAEREQQAERFDLERSNEEYAKWRREQPSRLLSTLSAPWFGRVAVAFFSVYMGVGTVPALAGAAPYATGAMLIVTFVGLRVFHWRGRKQRR
ncbi:hypothetical protein [Paraburkholderia sp. BL10I2N1]|uniref:hypothetical protein n=1 Tax=Paraburkholderia sp. BL10I2N1 TaxID=1938796 RepID=UPI00106003DD|nr:hypothetical protein [Paraburkholderia sp. BL10I2N1]TDN59087.1 hypothetical protein B0G77_8276 [Paraburkholderia sp. BL10I2N1]